MPAFCPGAAAQCLEVAGVSVSSGPALWPVSLLGSMVLLEQGMVGAGPGPRPLNPQPKIGMTYPAPQGGGLGRFSTSRPYLSDSGLPEGSKCLSDHIL